ncbi:hypothetical protein Taro_054087 [Colocasia esculenta]|uniref:Uncharacterized protein n=1 Tax=Colocasia esculenta TaxID=4460 RepID=A0A843XQ53_COLES|nr:hypothetical protein [Colocasia esculenta]
MTSSHIFSICGVFSRQKNWIPLIILIAFGLHIP